MGHSEHTETRFERVTRSGRFRLVCMGAKPEVVVVAASGDGIGALGAFLESFDRKAPVVVALHAGPALIGRTARLFERTYQLRIGVISAPLALDHYDVLFADGEHQAGLERKDGAVWACPTESVRVHGFGSAADPLFESAANVTRERTIAVVLQGLGCDGREGAAAVDRAGGLVLVQDPRRELAAGMPRAVVDSGLAAAVHSPSELGEHARSVFLDASVSEVSED